MRNRLIPTSILLILLAGCGGGSPPGSACTWPGGTVWAPQSAPVPPTTILYTVTRSSNTWVAAGLGGTLITSPNGLTWTAQTSGTTNTLLGSGVGPSHYLVVGENGTLLSAPLSMPSAWTLFLSNAQNLYDVAYGAGLYVAVGNGGTILTSSGPPGWSWTLLPPPTSDNLRGVVYAQDLGRFVAVGWGGVPLYSANGTTWSFGTVSPPNPLNHLNGVAYRPAAAGGPLFVAVGAGGWILTSPDGIQWTPQPSGTSQDLRGVDYGSGSGLFVAVGANGTILASASGTGWTPHTSGTTNYLFGVVGDLCDRFVAVGQNATLRTLP